MSEKIHKPTKYKLKKAREKGQAAKSVELASAFILFGSLLILWGCASLLSSQLQEVFLSIYSLLDRPSIDQAFMRAFSPIAMPIVLILLGILLIALGSHLVQTGWIWSRGRSKKASRPRLLFPLLKLLVISIIGYFEIFHKKATLQLIFATTNAKFVFVFKKLFFLLFEVSIALLILGIFDFFYQKWKFYKQMHMTDEELKEEKKETEGDKQTKSKMIQR